MKKFILKIFLFLGLFSVTVILIGKFDNLSRCRNVNPNIQKLNCSSSFDSLDILFIGNSYCYSGINPLYFDSVGIKSFNLGLATAGVNFYKVAIDDYLASVKKMPKSIFILVSPMIFSGKSDEIMNNPVYRFTNHPISNENYILFHDLSKLKIYPKVATRSFTRALSAPFGFLESKKSFCKDENNPMFASRGFVTSTAVNTPEAEIQTKHFFSPLLNDKFDLLKANAIVDIAIALKKKNIEVVFYELPSNKLYSFFNQDYLSGYSNFKLGLKSKFIFMEVNPQLSQNYYRDQDHLNASGAAVASRNMISQIMQNRVLSELFSH